jgi:hypothetical protein
MRQTLAIFPATLVIIALAGCGPVGVEPSASPTASPSAEASASPSPDAAPQPFAISECETMLPLILAKQVFSENVEFAGEVPVSEFGGRFDVPEIGVALSEASQSRLCRWIVPNSDGSFTLAVAELPEAPRDVLIVALSGAGFAPSTDGLTTTLNLEREGVVSVESQTHIFTAGVWIFVDGTGLELTDTVSSFALDVLRAANPTLRF